MHLRGGCIRTFQIDSARTIRRVFFLCLLALSSRLGTLQLLLVWKLLMPPTSKSKSPSNDLAALLPQRLSEALLRERTIPHFVDSYVVEHGRHSLQVHAVLYRDLLNLLQREALLTVTARALEIVTRGLDTDDDRKAKPMTRKEASAFRQKFLAGLTRHQRWNVSDALDFQSDLKMNEDLIARAVPASPSSPPIIPSWTAAPSSWIRLSSKGPVSPPVAPSRVSKPLRPRLPPKSSVPAGKDRTCRSDFAGQDSYSKNSSFTNFCPASAR